MASDALRTWRYARRQRTWFRSEPGIRWLPAGEGAVDAALEALSPLRERIGVAFYAGSR
jgi:tRNA A37 N6-isopentenylltransferase MiaA